MADLKIALRHMLRMLSAGQSAGLPDDELLMRFLEQPDEAAFESLLCRHGPMVLRDANPNWHYLCHKREPVPSWGGRTRLPGATFDLRV
jgi:hypothetical protein